ncbi:MAG: FAD-dependent oxidoreductase [Xanthobacteraceae bacterium]|nr:FAD-dependent oxidoreductase [Xanthobacteraceae bacterium]
MLGSIGAGAGLMGAIGPSTAQAALLPEPKASAAFDVVVIGTGMAGCAAALEAVGRGAKVAVLEKAEENRAGGNSAYAAGIFGMPRDDSQESRKMFLEDFVAKAQGRGNAKLYAVLAANARADLAWLRQNGVQFMPTEGTMPPYRIATVTTAPGTFMGMPRQLKAMRDRIVEKGGVIVFGTKARQLLMDDRGAVAGVARSAPTASSTTRALGRDRGRRLCRQQADSRTYSVWCVERTRASAFPRTRSAENPQGAFTTQQPRTSRRSGAGRCLRRGGDAGEEEASCPRACVRFFVA